MRRVLLQGLRGCHKTPRCRQHARGREAARWVLSEALKAMAVPARAVWEGRLWRDVFAFG